MSEYSEVLKSHLEKQNLTEEEWAKRDKEIEDKRIAADKREKLQAWQAKKELLLESGLTERHLAFCWNGKGSDCPAMATLDKLTTSGLSIISGNVGCGKTQAMHYWLLGGRNSPYTEWTHRGILRVTAAWFARSSRYAKDSSKFDLLKNPRRLVIDDLGVEFSDKAGSFLVDLDELLDLRWASNGETVICTNLPEQVFRDRYKRRIYDRVKGEGRWHDVKHPSWRGKEA
jgi:DNA replication protein DnaC